MQVFITSQTRSMPRSSSPRLIRASSLARFIAAIDRPERAAIASISSAVAKAKGTSSFGSGASGLSPASISASVFTKPPPME